MSGAVILIVEDNERNLKLLRDVLGVRGYRTVEARSGEEALDRVRVDPPHLVLMDIQLPGMDGIAALGELRALPGGAALPVVAVTAFAMKDDRGRILAAGFDGYLEKPIDIRTLPSTVESFLSAHGVETLQ